jgi:diadenosine tetraphosphate (Ap4A) HIT family hydrolase
MISEEAAVAASAVRGLGEALGRPVGKINVAALGNVVPQLHVHVVGRRADDPAWPGPVWGFGVAEPYGPDARSRTIRTVRTVFPESGWSEAQARR